MDELINYFNIRLFVITIKVQELAKDSSNVIYEIHWILQSIFDFNGIHPGKISLKELFRIITKISDVKQ